MPAKRRKSNYGICNSCEHFQLEDLEKCAQGIDNAKFNAQTKTCDMYLIKPEFVERHVSLEIPLNTSMESLTPDFFLNNIFFHGISNSNDVPENQIWLSEYQAEIAQTYQLIAKTLLLNKFPPSLINKSIASLDIETTSWMPSAQKGYINHVSQSYLQFKADSFLIATYQIINMNRKPENVGSMLLKTWKFLENGQFPQKIENSEDIPKDNSLDIQLVFNQGFDIRILNNCFTKFKLNLHFPETIVDLMKVHRNLAALEEWLGNEVQFSRTITEKGNYGEYYALFKKKQIEPISTYNIIDTLTPLLAYILRNKD
ncbi:hypothetical protein [Candidatus Lokiarchaeum ossiferum]|uniref:hypothetical protein n=1 Tax=Candidatus Lokiarchaeum ossiferum TaxID=2951803 RepID=UPI00352FE356